ncbi:hamartin isoform X2 [Hydra vulgaris]|uniref:Hamartin isoform X2 n=1 Tax=Hydra vulgaris TaxID=6087 RepID=A0ABM4BE12_HYDVU
MANVNAEAQEIIEYLESNDLNVVKNFVAIVQEKFYSSRDNALLGILVDTYVQTKSPRLVDVLVGVNDTQAVYLFEKLNDHLKHGALMEVCTLLFSIVRKQPSWLHRLVNTTLFATFLKYLKNENGVVFIMTGIITLCSLLPSVPAAISPHLGDVLEVFVRTSGMLVNKSGDIPEVFVLHLRVGLYIFFHRLYTMYPNNFTSYMRSCFGEQKNNLTFQNVIRPMFEFVKFHSDLITETRKSETRIEKWKIYQPHDIIAECAKISLDPVDAIKEATYIVDIKQTLPSDLTPKKSEIFFRQHHGNQLKVSQNQDKQINVALLDISSSQLSLCNPSELCGLSNPALSRPMSPSNSAHDCLSVNSFKPLYSENESISSIPNLIENLLERKSSGESSRDSPSFKLKNFENVPKTKVKRWMSNTTTHSTPLDQGSPRMSSTKSQSKRPCSTEGLIVKKDLAKTLSLGISDQLYVQSAPVSPMVKCNQQFAFSSNNVVSPLSEKKLKEESIVESKIPQADDTLSSINQINDSVSFSDVPSSMPLFSTIKDMFVELTVKPTRKDSDIVDIDCKHTCRTRSPLSLLDDFIQYGADVHFYELSRIPLTSQLDTDWTYFGGATPDDELKILQTQIQLLHIQLLYERHKCELHCLRNRRLFGNVQKSEGLQREIELLREQIALTEHSLKETKNTLNVACEEHKLYKMQALAKEQEFLTMISELESKCKVLQYKLKKCKSSKNEIRNKVAQQQKEVLKTSHQLFEKEQELLLLQPKLKNLHEHKIKLAKLTKELLRQSEKQELMKNQVKEFEFKNHHTVVLENKLSAHRRELKQLEEERDMLTIELVTYKNKTNDLEVSHVKKDKLIREHQTEIESIKNKHKLEIKVLEDRFNSVLKTCHSLQSYISSMFTNLENSDNPHGATKPFSMRSLNCGEASQKSSLAGLERRSPQLYNNCFTYSKIHENPFSRSKSSTSIGPHSSVLSSSLGSEKAELSVSSASDNF